MIYSKKKKQQIQFFNRCILESIDGNEFRWETFFRLWFREGGEPYYFLFKKNLSVTNTQFVELFSLISKYSSNYYNQDNDNKLLFYTTDHIKITFSEVITALLENYNPDDTKKFEDFCDKYLDVFCSTIAVDMFFSSCAVFIPNCIKINLEKIVSDAGYIHSAGKSIFIRNIKKAKKHEFLSSIDRYLELHSKTEKSIPFVVFSHEDFSDHDKEAADLIDKGIEQCKIYLDKMSMGSYRLSSIINELQHQDKYKKYLNVPNPGSYKEEHKFKADKTLWLISDRSISSGQIKNPGQARYYICYEQVLKNDSPFFYFDENKPAWKSHTTMPHSLTAALLNLSSPLKKDGVICDPFGGTGTTWLEVKRLNLNNKIYSSELSSSALLLLNDNVTFFNMTCNELKELYRDLKRYSSFKKEERQFQINFEEEVSPYQHALHILDTLKKSYPNEDQEFILDYTFCNMLSELTLLTRLFFYIGLRAHLRFQGSYTRKSLKFDDAFKKSLKNILDQITMLIKLKEEVEKVHGKYPKIEKNDSYIKSPGTYSTKLIPSIIFKDLNSLKSDMTLEVFGSTDARNLKKKSNDLIICDPPYGFNTSEDSEILTSLYSEFLDKAISSLKTNGQLIMCLPAESYTGRDLPFCTRSDLVSRQILIKAHQQKRLVYKPAQSIPMASLAPPYYWESDRALRRIILHFHFI